MLWTDSQLGQVWGMHGALGDAVGQCSGAQCASEGPNAGACPSCHDSPLQCTAPRYHGRLASFSQAQLGQAWLPPCTTKLRLLNVGCAARSGTCRAALSQLDSYKECAASNRDPGQPLCCIPSRRLRSVPGVVAHLPRLQRCVGCARQCQAACPNVDALAECHSAPPPSAGARPALRLP